MFNYEGRTFAAAGNTTGGDVDQSTLFHYHQLENVVWATYSGGAIAWGTLIATADGAGNLDMRYHHVALDGTIKVGKCRSRPERMPDGRIRLHEQWQWTEGAMGDGVSVVEEIVPAR